MKVMANPTQAQTQSSIMGDIRAAAADIGAMPAIDPNDPINNVRPGLDASVVPQVGQQEVLPPERLPDAQDPQHVHNHPVEIVQPKKQSAVTGDIPALLQSCWGEDCCIHDTLADIMRGAKVKKSAHNQFDLLLANNCRVGWCKLSDDSEFIGKRGWGKFDETSAKAVIAMCKARGWENITLTGTPECQFMMWKEAMREGLEVKGYNPPPQVMAQLKDTDPDIHAIVAERARKKAVEQGQENHIDTGARADAPAQSNFLPSSTPPAAPASNEAVAGLVSKLNTHAQKSPHTDEKAGIAVLCDAISSARVSLTENDVRKVESALKPRFVDADGLQQTGNAYDRVAAFMHTKGIELPAVSEESRNAYREEQKMGGNIIGSLADKYQSATNPEVKNGLMGIAAAIRQDKALFMPAEFENFERLYAQDPAKAVTKTLSAKKIDVDDVLAGDREKAAPAVAEPQTPKV